MPTRKALPDANCTDTPRHLLYFKLMSQTDQAKAIRKLATAGMSDSTIAAATLLSKEMVRRILAEAQHPL